MEPLKVMEPLKGLFLPNSMAKRKSITFDVPRKEDSHQKSNFEKIDTEEFAKKIGDIEKKTASNSTQREEILRAKKALNETQDKIKKHQIDLDLIVERGDNKEATYYIYGNNKALGKENILLNIPLSIEELEKLSGLLPNLFNTDLSLTGKYDFRDIRDDSITGILMGKLTLFLGDTLLLRTRTKSKSADIQDQKALSYNNNIAEEIFKFVSKLKGIPDEEINVEESILNSGKGDSNYGKIGFKGNPELEKMINPREVKLEKNNSSSILKFGTNISFVLYDEYSQGYIINFNEENLIKTTKYLIKQKRSIESIKDRDIINIIDGTQSKIFINRLPDEETRKKENKNFETQKKDTLERYKKFINACINLEKGEFHPGSYQIPE